MPPQPAARTQVEPWVLLCAHFMFSTGGFLSLLRFMLNPHEQEKAAGTLSKVWSDSSPAAVEEAKQLSNHVLEVVLQSQLSTFFLINCMTSVCAVATMATKVIFLGRLSVIETTKLTERLTMFLMLKIVFFGAVVNPTYRDVGAWLSWFFIMGYLKMFVGLAGDRCESLLSSPSSTPLQHLRCLALLLGILMHTAGWMADYVARAGLGEHAQLTSAALWLFDGVTVVVEAACGIVKYGVHALERWRALAAEKRGDDGSGPWEWQGSFLYHLELGQDLALHSLTLAHYLHLWVVHGLRFQLIDVILFFDVRYMASLIWRRLHGHARYRRLALLVEHSFPDASQEQLEGQECAICMERMKSAKVLPCRHVFHTTCLRAWLQQSRAGVFSCPLCRASLLVEEQAAAAAGAGTAAEGEEQFQSQHHTQHPHATGGWGHIGPHRPALPLAAGATSGAGAAALGPPLDGVGLDLAHGEEQEQQLPLVNRSLSLPLEPSAAPLLALLLASQRGWQQQGAGSGEAQGGDVPAVPGGDGGADGSGSGLAVERHFWESFRRFSEERGAVDLHASLAVDSAGTYRTASGGVTSSIAHRIGRSLLHAAHLDADLEDTAAGPSSGPWAAAANATTTAAAAAAAHEAERRAGGEGEEGLQEEQEQQHGRLGAASLATAMVATATVLTASVATQSLRTLSRAVSHLSGPLAPQGVGEAQDGSQEEEGVVDQPMASAMLPRLAAQQPHVPTHRYSTRSKARLARGG